MIITSNLLFINVRDPANDEICYTATVGLMRHCLFMVVFMRMPLP